MLGVREGGAVVVCRVLELACAIPVESVIETMRPLPLDAFAAMPAFVLGVSIIRGAPVVVLDAGLLIGTRSSSGGRIITLRVGPRTIALTVDSVIGVRRLGAETLEQLSPLLEAGSGDAIAAIGAVDSELLVLLRAARLVPEDVLVRLEGARS